MNQIQLTKVHLITIDREKLSKRFVRSCVKRFVQVIFSIIKPRLQFLNWLKAFYKTMNFGRERLKSEEEEILLLFAHFLF